jgi:hypothetical protein
MIHQEAVTKFHDQRVNLETWLSTVLIEMVSSRAMVGFENRAGLLRRSVIARRCSGGLRLRRSEEDGQ